MRREAERLWQMEKRQGAGALTWGPQVALCPWGKGVLTFCCDRRCQQKVHVLLRTQPSRISQRSPPVGQHPGRKPGLSTAASCLLLDTGRRLAPWWLLS